MIKKPFKKSYANTSSKGYSKEYMQKYMAWYSTLSKSKQKSLENCNDRETSVREFRKKKRALGKTLHKNQKYVDISKRKS